MSDFNPLDAYKNGLLGCRQDLRADEEFADSVLRHGGNPDGAAVASEWEFADAGRGKLTMLFPVVDKIFPGSFPGPTQLTGDCFPAGTLVRMSDGSEKPIESVSVGERVVSHTGAARDVEHIIKKPYKGDLLTVSIKGYGRTVTCTPDHRIFAGGDGESFWCPADLLTDGTQVLLPRERHDKQPEVFDLQDSPRAIRFESPGRNVGPSSLQKARWLCMKHEVNRFVELDSRLGWLIGLYLAEGSCDVGANGPQRITLNLSAKETFLAEIAAGFVKEVFGVDAIVSQVPSKPSVLYVRIASAPVANLFKRLAPGNTYTKRVSPELMAALPRVKAAVLRGWFAGDGNLSHVRSSKKKWQGHDSIRATGVSVSAELIDDMLRLANSCGAFATVCRRKARKASRAASSLVLYGENVYYAFPAVSEDYCLKVGAARRGGDLGMWKPVSAVSRSAFEGEVYCLQVAEDHSFVAEGVAVHNCVARATANCLLTTIAVEINDGKPDEVTGLVEGAPELPREGVEQGAIAPESLWAWRGFDSDGWVCSKSAEVATTKGFLVRKPYPDLGIDLTRYTDKTIRLGGSRTPGAMWLAESSKYVARTATVVKGREQVRDFLAAGYAVFNCSALGFDNKRNEDGVSRQVGVWHHAQLFHGYDDRPETVRKYGRPLVCWQNSWARWNTGPRRVMGTEIDIPHGAFWALASTIDKCSCIALSSVAGWPRRKLPSYGAKGNI